VAVLTFISLAGCAGHLASSTDVFTMHREVITVASHPMHIMLVKPASPRPSPVLVVFASGDGGMMGISKAILQHLGDKGYYVAGYSSREALARFRGSGGVANYAAVIAAHVSMNAQAKRALGLPDRTPIIMTGMSRGASMVIVAAGDSTLCPGIAGAVAIALTRELDYLHVPKHAGRSRGIKLDKNRKVRTYPAIERLGSIPLAIIQSTNDKYVPSAESRRLLGPDTPTRHLYEVEARNHGFNGGQEALMRDLDDALKWITAHR
jgi:type IV secretory pathway VirJ component